MIPSQGTCLGCRFDPQCEAYRSDFEYVFICLMAFLIFSFEKYPFVGDGDEFSLTQDAQNASELAI